MDYGRKAEKCINKAGKRERAVFGNLYAFESSYVLLEYLQSGRVQNNEIFWAEIPPLELDLLFNAVNIFGY